MSPCERREPLLTALADGELGRVAAWRVRRHLAACARCAALYAEIEGVNTAARAYAGATDSAPLPADFAVKARRLLQTAPLIEPEEETMPAPIVPSRSLSAVLFPPVLRPAIAAVAVVAAAVGIGSNVLMAGKPRVAFADVRRAVEQVRTAHMSLRVTEQGEGVQVIDAWVRTDPAGFAMLLPEKVRLVGDAKGVTVYPGQGEDPIHVSDEKVTKGVVTDLLLAPDGLLGDTPGKPGAVPTDWGTPEVVPGPDGRPLLRFHTEKEGAKCVLWADPETRRPVRVEVDQEGGKDGDGPSRVEVEFAYNEAPPPGTF